jgi:lysophospholipase L1-like esterase
VTFQAASNAWFADTVLFTPRGSGGTAYVEHDPYARVAIVTSATSIIIEAVTQNPSGTGGDETLQPNGTAPGDNDLANVGVFVNGAHYTDVVFNVPDGTKSQQTVSLPAGANKLVEFQERAHLTGLDGTFTVVPVGAPAHGRRLVVYGDSIPAGFRAEVNGSGSFFLGWPMLLRASGVCGVTNFSISGDELYAGLFNMTGGDLNAAVAIKAAQLVARCADGTTQRAVWFELGTNDWGFSHAPLSTFTSLYGQLLDAVHALDPSIHFYCQTPLYRGNGANGQGYTLPQMRTAIAGIVAARSGYCSLVDGLQIDMTGSPDGVHPNAAQHVAICNLALATLGSTLPLAPSALSLHGTANSVTVAWTDNATDETGYYVYYSTTGVKPGTPQITLPSGSTSTTVSGLTSGSTYTFWVEAYNAIGASASIAGSVFLSVPVPVPKFQMQGTIAGLQLLTWLADAPDWTGAFAPVPVTDVTLYARSRGRA